MPPATMDAYRDHGHPRPSLEEDVAGARAVMDALPKVGISIDAVTAKLVDDGVRLFADAADQLYAAVQKKRRAVLGAKLNAMSYKLPEELQKDVRAVLEDWRKATSAPDGCLRSGILSWPPSASLLKISLRRGPKVVQSAVSSLIFKPSFSSTCTTIVFFSRSCG